MSTFDPASLSPTARVILGFLFLGEETGYDIKQVTDRSTRYFWGASYGQIYPELRRLEAAGLVRSRDEPRGGVPRRVYELTPAGTEAFDAWLRADGPDRFELRDEGLLRLFFAGALDHEALLALVRRRRAWYELSAEEFGAIEEHFGGLGETTYGAVLDFAIEWMEWSAAWFAELEERLSRGEGPRSPRRPPSGTEAQGPP
jgi:DNA-binding PadR family transcriptional regulator